MDAMELRVSQAMEQVNQGLRDPLDPQVLTVRRVKGVTHLLVGRELKGRRVTQVEMEPQVLQDRRENLDIKEPLVKAVYLVNLAILVHQVRRE
jgi:hypothetical protein